MQLEMIKESELNELLKDKKIDFVATVISHWHAIGLDAFLYDHFINNNKIQGIILIQPHSENGYIINEKDFAFRNFNDSNIYYIDENFFYPHRKNNNLLIKSAEFFYQYFKPILNKVMFYNKKYNNIFLIYPWFPTINLIKKIFLHNNLSKKYSPHMIIIDEGIGTYISDEASKIVIGSNISFKDKIKNLLDISLASFERKILSNNVPIQTRFLFRSSIKNSNNLKRRFEVNNDIVNSYKRILKIRKKNLHIKSTNTIIFLSQPYSEYCLCSLEDELMIIESLVQFLVNNNFSIILKLHPREYEGKYDRIIEKYNIEKIPQDFPIEDIFSGFKPICVIGTLSTGLINANLFFDLKSISIVDMIISFAKIEILKVSADEFRSIAGDMVLYAEDFKKLISLIRN